LGRRRKRVVKIVKRKLPTVFECPKCGENSIRVNLMKDSKKAIVQCGSCGIKEEFNMLKSDEVIDIYCQFTDKIHKELGS
jgi:transcription elongation factor Elf1